MPVPPACRPPGSVYGQRSRSRSDASGHPRRPVQVPAGVNTPTAVRGGQPLFHLNGGWRPPGGRRILGCVLAWVRKCFDGAGWFVGGAVVLLVFALLAVLVELQSPDRVLWTGQQVVGTEQGGIVTYRWDGQSYSLDVPGYGSSKAVSVYLNPGDPSQAMADNVFDRVVAALLVLGPAAGAVVLLVIGGTRNYRWSRRKIKRAREFMF